MEFTGCSTIGAVGRDEGCKSNCAGVREEERNLQKTSLPVYHEFRIPPAQCAHLSNPPDILIAIFLTKTKILVQAKANIVPVEAVGS